VTTVTQRQFFYNFFELRFSRVFAVLVIVSAVAIRHNARMQDHADPISDSTSAAIVRWLKRHAVILVLLGGALLALPAYLNAMHLQFLDMEFLTSLCGISGWGSGGK